MNAKLHYCYRADIMPHVYKCKASRGRAPLEVLDRAAKEMREEETHLSRSKG